jgi:hypothetical protein
MFAGETRDLPTDQTTCDIYASLLRQGLNTQRRFVHAKGNDSDLPRVTRKQSAFTVFCRCEGMAIAEGTRRCSGAR